MNLSTHVTVDSKSKRKKGKRKTGENQRALIKGTSFKDTTNQVLF